LLTAGGLKYVALLLDIMFKGYPTLLLFFVMVACPLGMNLIQVSAHPQWVSLRAFLWEKCVIVVANFAFSSYVGSAGMDSRCFSEAQSH
jgi:hypothetical protein